MGSEHYCLRWNNHQSNLLGVFSQLLQDESLVDVTLACSEGASIRAHKVVLSACSSYFQSLFLDHPARHPIVILKDVRFSELRTLVEFMYKGEVNVQYCQLSALLKTAESLKVKGLAEMTNQSTALREPEREQDCLRPPQITTSSSVATSSSSSSSSASRLLPTTTESLDTTTPVTNTALSGNSSGNSGTLGGVGNSGNSGNNGGSGSGGSGSSSGNQSSINTGTISAKRLESIERCSPSPTRLSPSPTPLALYHRKSNRDYSLEPPETTTNNNEHHSMGGVGSGGGGIGTGGGGGGIGCGSGNGNGGSGNNIGGIIGCGSLGGSNTNILSGSGSIGGGCAGIANSDLSNDDCRSQSPEDDAMDNDVGINMTINSNSTNSISHQFQQHHQQQQQQQQQHHHHHHHQHQSHQHQQQQQQHQQPPPSTTSAPSSSSSSSTSLPAAINSNTTTNLNRSSSITPELRPGSRSGGGGIGGGSSPSNLPTCSTTAAMSSSSPNLSSEPVAGPSGLGPVQSVPLSLKKEIEWDRSDDKSIGECSSDYSIRHQHESEATDPHGGSLDQGVTSGGQIFQCMYCGATYPQQSKLTRHILSHSLETLKYRESTHYLHLTNFPHDIPPPPPHNFGQRSIQSSLDSLEPPDGTPMEIEFAAAAAVAAAAAASASLGGGSGSGGGSGNSISNRGGLGGLGGSGGDADQGNVVLCKFCGKSFPDVSSLITHLPAHTGDRPFKCEFCGKAFKLRHHMKDHCRVHTGERPFRCGMCGKTFSRSTILKAHEKTHYPKFVRKYLSPSPVDTKDEPPN